MKAWKKRKLQSSELNNASVVGLRPELAEELKKIKKDEKLCDKDEVKCMEDMELSVSNLGVLEPTNMSKLAVHVLYDRISNACNIGELDDALADYTAPDVSIDEEQQVEGIKNFCDALQLGSVLLPSQSIQQMRRFIAGILSVVAEGCPAHTQNMRVSPTDFLAIAAPFKSRRSVKPSMVLDFLLLRRFFPAVCAVGAEAVTLGEMMEAMNRVDRWCETRPALSRFLDPPCVIVESLAAGGGPVAGLGASIAASPIQHGAVLLPDTVTGGGAAWDNVISCATKEAAVPTATLIRGRHAGPGGVGGGVAGADPCRVMYFNMTNANHVEF